MHWSRISCALLLFLQNPQSRLSRHLLEWYIWERPSQNISICRSCFLPVKKHGCFLLGLPGQHLQFDSLLGNPSWSPSQKTAGHRWVPGRRHIQYFGSCTLDSKVRFHVGVSKNMGKPSNHPLVHRVWKHYFHHPFWGPPIFLETSM